MLRQRVLTAIIALVVMALVLYVVPDSVGRWFIAVLILAAAWEWAGFLSAETNSRRIFYVIFIGLLIAGLIVGLPGRLSANSVYIFALVWWSVALIWLFFYPTPISKALAWLCGAVVLIPAWVALDHLYLYSADLLLFLLLIVWLADIGAYFCGRAFGRVKLAPSISPGKTWEGVFGGLAAVLVLATVGADYLQIEMTILIPFCLAVALLSVVGDLTVSMFKRNAGVKDSGSLFPGHGGVLDRIDSVTAAAPLYAVGIGWFGI